MRYVRHSVKLQHHNFIGLRAFDHFFEMFKCPSRIRITSRRDEKRVMFCEIKRRPHLNRTVRFFRLHPASRYLIAMPTQLFNGLRSKSVPAPGEAHRFRNPDSGELLFDQLKFFPELSSLLGFAEVGVSPAMVSDLKSQAIKLCCILPRQEVCLIIHPILGNKESSLKSQLF